MASSSIPKRLFRMRLRRVPADGLVTSGIGHDFLAARHGRTYEEVAQLVRASGQVGRWL